MNGTDQHRNPAESAVGDDRPKFRFFAALYLLALAVRVAACVVIGPGDSLDGDEVEHFDAAVNMVNGLGYALVPQQAEHDVPEPTAFRMPGPSLLMAGAMWVFGTEVIVTRILAILISSLSVPLMYLLVRRFADHRIALATALVCAVYPTWVYNSITIKSEPYFVPMLMLSMICSVAAADRVSLAAGTRAGLLWGLTALIKPFGLPMMGLTALYLWAVSGFRRWLPSVAVGCAFGLVLTPWIIRNYVVFDHFIPLATEGSETFLGANNPYTATDPAVRGIWISPMKIPEYIEALRPVKGELNRAGARYDIATSYLRSNPDVIPKLMWWKVTRFLTPIPGSGGGVAVVVLCTWGLLLVLLLVGAVARIIRPSHSLHFALLWVFTQLVVTSVYNGGLTRGRMPLELMLLPWGVVTAVALFDAVRCCVKTTGRRTAGVASGTA